ncbi:RNA 2',3'-cyclic phosphodiesterase [Pontibacter vulgaris]|uniref:RNA 2',3'-cyclic phosphodiesterase n=1 Tax=Pontibacter vulgaris TaxID=2905679 RepID=UPI001FA7F411|nr:RNA 2',3'-cyclic phosphodiesterase [Pontibacter vulgaris]
MTNTIRLFVAAALPPALKKHLSEAVGHFTDPVIRVLPEENLHLTLYFIGNVPPSELPRIKQSIQQVAQNHAPFTLELEQTEPGPKPKSPRLIWARFAQSTPFENLSRDLTNALAPQPPARQKAIAHITLARFRKDKPAPKGLPNIAPDTPVSLAVDTIGLWQSEITSPHPRYSVLETYSLSQNQ